MFTLSHIAAGLFVAVGFLADSTHALEDATVSHHHHQHHARHHAGVSRLAEADVAKDAGALEVRANGGRGKAGLAWNNGENINMKQYMTTNKVSWYYTWSPWPACKGKGCPTWCPMLWSSKQVDHWKRNVWGKSFECVLGFNEPDIKGQSNMSVGEGIKLWNKWIKPVKAFHVSPAVTLSPKGEKWLGDFIKQCKNCDIDAYAVHYYGIDADDFIKRVTAFHNANPKKPIWVTEFACHNYGDPKRGQCNPEKIKKFMKKAQVWLDKTSWVQKYAWFAANAKRPEGVPFNVQNMIMTPGGKINDLGRQYIGQ